MFVCHELQQRLDRAWSKLQEAFWQEGISQIDLDTLCVERIEKLAEEIVAIPTYSIVRQNETPLSQEEREMLGRLYDPVQHQQELKKLKELKKNKKIFNSTAQTPGYPGYPERSGQTVTVVRQLTKDEYNDIRPMYRIQFVDGTITDAFEEELTERQ